MAVFSGIIAALGAAGFGGAVTIFGLSPAMSAALLSVGRAVLWNQVAKALAPGVPAQHVQATIAQSSGPRIRAYGEVLLGGTRALWEASDDLLHQIVVMHHGEVHQIVGWLVDGEAVTIDGSGAVTSGPSTGYLTIKAILSGNGGNYSEARTAFPTIWTTDHDLTGLATFYTRMKAPSLSRMTKVFPRQHNTAVQAIVRTSKVLDPRTGTVVYSRLTGPCVMDYLTHVDGYRVPLASVDQDSFADFTDLCDQNVALKSGSSEKRYAVGGYYTLEDAPKDVMARLLATADAQLYMTAEGKVGILGGEWLAPDVTIRADDILSLQLTDGFDEFTDFNVLKGKFTSPNHAHQETECAELVDSVALATQPQRDETLTVDMCPSHSQMQRLMKAYRASKIRRFTGTMMTNLVGMKARFPRGKGRHVIAIETIAFGTLTVEVLSHSYSMADRTCMLTIATLDNPYGWNAATDEGDAPPPLDALLKPSNAVPAPTGLTLSQEVVENGGNSNSVRIAASVSDPGRDALQLVLQYRPVGGGSWQAMVVGDGDLRGASYTVSSGVTYEVRAGWQGYDNWSAIVTITAVSNPIAPDAPTGFTSSLAGGTVTLNWTNGDIGFYRTRVYRGPTTNFNDASVIATVAGVAGQPSSKTNAPGTGTWRYWVVTINASGVESTTKTGPVSHTI